MMIQIAFFMEIHESIAFLIFGYLVLRAAISFQGWRTALKIHMDTAWNVVACLVLSNTVNSLDYAACLPLYTHIQIFTVQPIRYQ